MIWENIPIKRKGKPTRYVSARNIPIADNHLMISLVWDVTERKIAESDLEESEKKYRSIVQYLPEAVIIHSQGKILYANPQTLKLIGAESFEQIKNIPAINFVHQDYRTHAIERISRILKNKETAELTEEKFVKLNGEVFDVEVIGVPINYEGKESIQTIIRDISERKKAEQELEEHRFHLEDLVKKRTIDLEDVNKKLEEEISKVREAEEKVKIALVKEQELGELKSRFISITSHEFRTPLTSLLSSVEILEMGGRNYDDDKRNIHYQKIKNNIEFMIKMIDELLYLNRIDSNRIKVSYIKTNLMDFCTELFDSIKGNYNTIEAVIDAKLGKTEFNIDRDLLRKILTNLLVNAFKFNKENGKVNFAVSSMNDKLFFSISDTGIGIPEEEQKNLFEPFTRMSNSQQVKGTGLGLNIVKKSVDQLGGSVTFTSNKNGTVFTVVIPHY
jgi:PAS domain S-box-containing protein